MGNLLDRTTASGLDKGILGKRSSLLVTVSKISSCFLNLTPVTPHSRAHTSHLVPDPILEQPGIFEFSLPSIPFIVSPWLRVLTIKQNLGDLVCGICCFSIPYLTLINLRFMFRLSFWQITNYLVLVLASSDSLTSAFAPPWPVPIAVVSLPLYCLPSFSYNTFVIYSNGNL